MSPFVANVPKLIRALLKEVESLLSLIAVSFGTVASLLERRLDNRVLLLLRSSPRNGSL